jgi:segregation and condensation protein A
MEPPYNIQIQTYEGPLDLLLDLIRKQEINIYDIPIAQITGQYLDYLHRNLERLDTEVAGEFLVMAATLIHIKSKMLLPPDSAAQAEETEDPRTDLVHQLLEHEKFKKAAQMLQQKQLVQGAVWSAPGLSEFLDPDAEPEMAVSLFDLVKAFQQVLDRARERPLLDIAEECSKVCALEMPWWPASSPCWS